MSAPPLQPIVIWFGRVGDMILLSALLEILHRRYGSGCHVIGAGAFPAQIYAAHRDVARAVGEPQGEIFVTESQSVSRSRESNGHISVRSDDSLYRRFPPCHIWHPFSRKSHARDGVFVSGLPGSRFLSQVQYREPREIEVLDTIAHPDKKDHRPAASLAIWGNSRW